jgi:hypothetical protein
MRTGQRSPTTWARLAAGLPPGVVTSGGERIARCQGCGAELQDAAQRFCGGDRCLLVLMRCPGPSTLKADTDSRFPT